MVSAMSKVLTDLLKANQVHLDAIDATDLMNSLILSQSQRSLVDFDALYVREHIQWVLQQLIRQSSPQQKLSLFKQCLNCLSKKKILLQKDFFETFNFISKNQRIGSSLNNNQVGILMQTLTQILFHSESAFVHDNFSDEKEVLDAITPWLRESDTVKVYALEVVKTLGFRAPQWLH